MHGKKLAKRIKAAVQEGVASGMSGFVKEVHSLNQSVRTAARGGDAAGFRPVNGARRAAVIDKKDKEKLRRLAAGMTGRLYNDLSGVTSRGQAYTFELGTDAEVLDNVKKKLERDRSLTKRDVLHVFKIYMQFFKNETSHIESIARELGEILD